MELNDHLMDPKTPMATGLSHSPGVSWRGNDIVALRSSETRGLMLGNRTWYRGTMTRVLTAAVWSRFMITTLGKWHTQAPCCLMPRC